MKHFSTLTTTLAVLALSVAVSGCDKKPDPPAPSTESTESTKDKKDKKDDKSADDDDDKGKSKDKDKGDDDDQAKADDSAAPVDPANPPDKEAEAVPVPSDYEEAAQSTIKPTDDYKGMLDQLETDINKE